MNQILCSTGAIVGRPNGRDIALLNQCLDRLECDGYEFMMYETWYDKLDEICHFMAHFSAPVPVFHVEKQVGDRISRNKQGDMEEALRLFEINCAMAQEFGSKMLVLHLWSGLDSDKDIPHNVKCYPYLREISDRHDLTLTVENVVCNHADPMSHMIPLAQVYPDIEFTFDTKMAAFHSQLDLLYEADNRWLLDHIHHMHINDYGGGHKDWTKLNTLHIGDGHVDFDKLFDFIREWGYRGDFTIEATSFDQSGQIDFDKLNQSIRTIKGYLS